MSISYNVQNLQVGDIFSKTFGGDPYVVLNIDDEDIEIGFYFGHGTNSKPVETVQKRYRICRLIGRCQVIPPPGDWSMSYMLVSTDQTPLYVRTSRKESKDMPMQSPAAVERERLLEKLLKKSSELDNEEIWANELRSRGYEVTPPEGHDPENRRKGVLDAIQVVQEMKTILVGE